jgi:transcriptional regulator
MYTPGFNVVEDRATLLEAMERYSFAVLYGPGAEGRPVATHLPLVVEDDGPHGVLYGHFARANAHWRGLAGQETLVVFSGPHSYVTPALYEDRQSVPTWNYIAVHAYGELDLVEGEGEKDVLLEKLIAVTEPGFAQTWRGMPEKYRTGMLKGIVGFRIRISRIEGKFKISQNREAVERRNVQAAHAAGTDDQRALAEWMARINGREK